jgi:hypothetical protein
MRVHIAKLCQEYQKEYSITRMDWLPSFPDWTLLKVRLRKRQQDLSKSFNTEEEFIQAAVLKIAGYFSRDTCSHKETIVLEGCLQLRIVDYLIFYPFSYSRLLILLLLLLLLFIQVYCPHATLGYERPTPHL